MILCGSQVSILSLMKCELVFKFMSQLTQPYRRFLNFFVITLRVKFQFYVLISVRTVLAGIYGDGYDLLLAGFAVDLCYLLRWSLVEKGRAVYLHSQHSSIFPPFK